MKENKMFSKEASNNNMNFMTLQRPTFEEMERRRMIRENMSPQRSTTLQRRESMISRGLNAIMRRQSFMGSPSKPANNLKRNDSFFMHSALLSNRDDPGPSLILSNEGTNEHPLHTITRPSRPNLGRAKSFKYPEKVSQIPPAELTRLRSKSQVRPDPYYNSAGSSDDPVYTSGSGGSAAGSGKSMLRRKPTFNLGPSRYDRNEFNGSKYFQRDSFQPPPRVLPRRPSPRDISEPPPGSGSKRRLPLPDIFFYGDRWQEQETKSRPMPMASTNSSLETPEPPPGSSDIGNHQNTR